MCGRGVLCDFHGADFPFVGARKSLPFAGFALPLENAKGDAAFGAFPRGALPLRILRSSADTQLRIMRICA